MGLEEDRAKQGAEKWLPERQKELNELCGGNIPYEIDWASFAGDVKGISWLENNGPAIVARAFRIVCNDALGKAAVVKAIRKVVLRNVKESKDKNVDLAGGTLTCAFAFAQSPGGRLSEHDVANYLTKNL